MWFSHFSERIMPPARPPGPHQFVKFLISIVEKKDLNENYEKKIILVWVLFLWFSHFSERLTI